MLHFDGIYQSEKQTSYEDYFSTSSYHYLRFYDDGTVISVGSTGTPVQVASWFNQENENMPRGTYIITGNQLLFSTIELKKHKTDYDCILMEDKIECHIYSHFNQTRAKQTYTFVKMEKSKELL
jgi:hypothetical protein